MLKVSPKKTKFLLEYRRPSLIAGLVLVVLTIRGLLLLPSVNFINVFSGFFCTKFWRQAAEMTFVQKTRANNVDKIDT